MTSHLTKLWTILVAGALATISFDFFGQVLSPAAGFAQLAPVGLANSVIKAIFGSGYRPGAEAMHLIAGTLAYPLGWVLIARPIWQRTLPQIHFAIPAIAYGIGLWVFALYGMAHLVAGMKPFLGFTGITWVAFWGHILYAIVAVGVIELSAKSSRRTAFSHA